MIINILEASLYNKIAAGEVIENPSSVVKELLDNSIDAGSNRIIVEVLKGGIKSITVTDNGSGVLNSEIAKTVLPHATSKISKVDDLFSLSSLGFRGEALASISSVSDFYIKTRHFSEEIGSHLSIENAVLKVENCAWEAGTSITVNNLFYNTPARYKFLGSTLSEENNIKKLIYQYILANPFVSISLKIDNKTIYSSTGEGLLSACESVLTKELASKLLFFDDSLDNIKISGYISPPELYRGNRNYQTIVVNGRVISDPNITATIQNAFSGLLMKHSFPVYVIDVIIPFKEVDVNVHPSKKEVRFSNPRTIYGKIYRVIKSTIDKNILKTQTKLFTDSSTVELRSDFKAETDIIKSHPKQLNHDEDNNSTINDRTKVGSTQKQQFVDNDQTNPASSNKSLPSEPTHSNISHNTINPPSKHSSSTDNFIENYTIPDGNIVQERVNRTIDSIKLVDSSNNEDDNKKIDSSSYCIIGQVFGTYLIIETGNYVMIFDQHAFHERILYEEYLTSLSNNKIVSQDLLIPYVFDCSSTQKSILMRAKEHLTHLGFHIEDFGQSIIRVVSVPLEFTDSIDFSLFFEELLNEIEKDTLGASVVEKLLYEKVASIACKASIKGNTRLSNEQIQTVIEYFLESNKPLFCPHGRPTFVTLEKKDFDKMFRRIK